VTASAFYGTYVSSSSNLIQWLRHSIAVKRDTAYPQRISTLSARKLGDMRIPGMMKAQSAAISRCRTGIGKFSRDRRLLSQPAQSSHALPALVKASIASIRLGKTRKKGSNLVISNSCHTRGFTPLKAILLPDFWQLT
jgi:hypothetical protein